MSKQPSSDGPIEHPPQLIATAYHEAGHAVMAVSLGRLIQKVTIAPGKSQFGPMRLGTCQLKKGRSKARQDPLEDDVLILLAGMVGESLVTGEYSTTGAAADLAEVSKLLCTRAASQRQHETLSKRMLAKTEHHLHDASHQAAIESIAFELLEKTTVSGRLVVHHFNQATQRKQKG